MNLFQQSRTKEMTKTALMTAALCILGPMVLPIGPVPISLQTLVLYITIYVLGTRQAFLSCLLYLMLGLAGLPVLSGFSGGPQKFAGPTGGYLIGFLLMVLIAGLIIDRGYQKKLRCAASMILGTAVAYLLGTLWLAQSAGMDLQAAVMVGVVPFLLVDLGKILLAAFLGPLLRDRLIQAGLFHTDS